MQDKLSKFLEQIKLDKKCFSYFNNGKLLGIKRNGDTTNAVFSFLLDSILPIDVYQSMYEKIVKTFSLEKADLMIETNSNNYALLKDYFTYFKIDNVDKLIFLNNIVENVSEEVMAKKEETISLLNKCGFSDIELIGTPKKENSSEILGTIIETEMSEIHNINTEINDVTIEANVFDIDFFESKKTNFRVVTLKVTDFTDSIYVKVFARTVEELEDIKNKVKTGNWYKFRGYTKFDEYSRNELVLFARDISLSEKEIVTRKDAAKETRVELHAHTCMSQMDGLMDAKSFVKKVHDLGHKAVAITDHNCVQAFPDVFYAVKDINKGLAEGEEPFKAIYGAEISIIDDSVDIVFRAPKGNLLEQTYVVFDFETTGFNAGGKDTVIEVGAVKILNGEIIDRFSELINPGHKLPKTIIEITNITDEMLIGKRNEEEVLKDFVAWVGDLPMVAHNAKFDASFLMMGYRKYNLGKYENPLIDTLALSHVIDSGFARHSLSALVKRYEVPFDEEAHHRADYDAEGTALVFHKMLQKLAMQNIDTFEKLEKMVVKEEIHKYGKEYHMNVLVQNQIGLKNLFKIISYANTKYLYHTPRIIRSELETLREGLLFGSGCYNGEIFHQARSKSDEELANLINFYDYIEIQPLECYDHLLEASEFGNKLELVNHLKKIIKVTESSSKLIVATGDVHHFNADDKIYREIIVNQKVPGGGRHPLARYNLKEIPNNYFRTTEEMLTAFDFLDKKTAKRLVIENPKKIAELIEDVTIIQKDLFTPLMENSAETTKEIVYGKAKELYGEQLPELISERLQKELNGIINGGYDVIYLIAQKLVKKSNDDGYLVGSRGSVGSSFVATMMGITEVNPLPPHYLCPKCQTSIFEENGNSFSSKYASGYDLPDKKCSCGAQFLKEGQDIPFSSFLGWNAEKVPDIDLNFSSEYQSRAHDYTKVLFGEANVFRAGTIGTVANKTAYGFVKGYCEDNGISMRSAEVERLAKGVVGVKRTTGQHPGGIIVIPAYKDIFDFTPYQYPADDTNSRWYTTHLDFHAIHDNVLKLDILGHDDPTMLKMLSDVSNISIDDIPFNDSKVLSIFSSPLALGVTEKEINCPTGTLGVPEFGTNLTIRMLAEIKPNSFADLVKVSGLSHGTGIWSGNGQELLKKGISFADIIGCREELITTLIKYGMDGSAAFKITEFIRKSYAPRDSKLKNPKWLALKPDLDAIKDSLPKWFIESIETIEYMFPKAHATAYVMMGYRVAWYKLYHPIYYYSAYFSKRCFDFDIEVMIKGYDAIKNRINEILDKKYDATNKESSILDVLSVSLEATARGFKFGSIDLEKSDSRNFLIGDDNKTLIPPFRSLDGLGDVVAENIIEERKKAPFLSIEDLQRRCKISLTLIDKMRLMGILDNMEESNQLSLF